MYKIIPYELEDSLYTCYVKEEHVYRINISRDIMRYADYAIKHTVTEDGIIEVSVAKKQN